MCDRVHSTEKDKARSNGDLYGVGPVGYRERSIIQYYSSSYISYPLEGKQHKKNTNIGLTLVPRLKATS
ncbi:unnamed protein product [Dovyalis caffra]|uniref:Uncharacterized protein n=1 Tax=Dovyalis caffra TaxID=77055 RepID=A0AAV1SEG2_9ROSI|nr:unnamed protein product [Dovyalis caffra]